MSEWAHVRLAVPVDLSGVEAEALVESLSKAVAPHISQAQPRTKVGRFAKYGWRSFLPRDAKGRFVARLTAAERADATRTALDYQQSLGRRLHWHMSDLREGGDLEMAVARGTADIEHFYTLLYRTGTQAAGFPGVSLQPHEKALIGRLVRDEADFWRGFMGDVADGAGRIPYPTRLGMYENAAKQLYWLGFVVGNHSPARRIVWNLGPTDHCATCKRMAEHGQWTVDDFLREGIAKGFVPQGGDLECHGIKCKCWLTETFVRARR